MFYPISGNGFRENISFYIHLVLLNKPAARNLLDAKQINKHVMNDPY